VSSGQGFVAKVDPSTNLVNQVIDTRPDLPGDIAVTDRSVWAAGQLQGVLRIDIGSGQLERMKPVDDEAGRRLSVSTLGILDGSIWATGGWAKPNPRGSNLSYVAVDERGVVQLNAMSGRIERVVDFTGPLSTRANTGLRLWLSAMASSKIYVLDPGSSRLELAALLDEPGTVIGAVGEDLWVARPHQVLERFHVAQ
jgi:hypothetical protein